ncbi:hypothetical protein IAT38_000033 [Cryptococcus sp. DSM 104549]
MSAFEIPKTMRALTQDETTRTASIKENIPVPEIRDNHVLVKIEYVAQNPTDWKHTAFWSPPGVINGCDFSGTVVRLGTNLKVDLKIGDKVAGTVHGGWAKDEGAYAQYARVESDLCFKVPEGMKLEEAATFGIGWWTAVQTIIDHQGKAFPPNTNVTGNPWYIIYGASSSVGLFGIQIAKVLGYHVLAVCSPHSFDLVKSYGADATVSYHDQAKAIEEAKQITGGGVEYALDTISEGDSFKIIIGMMGDKGKKLCAILPPGEEAKKINPKIEIENTWMYTFFGVEFDFTPVAPERMIIPYIAHDRAFGAEVNRVTPDMITKYGIKANPVVIRGGLDDVLKGFENQRAGKVSGIKYVYKIE